MEQGDSSASERFDNFHRARFETCLVRIVVHEVVVDLLLELFDGVSYTEHGVQPHCFFGHGHGAEAFSLVGRDVRSDAGREDVLHAKLRVRRVEQGSVAVEDEPCPVRQVNWLPHGLVLSRW